MYEFWQGLNNYGLVELLEQAENTRPTAYRQARARANDQNKVIEKRRIKRGLILVYHDFANYKANLAAVRSEEVE